MKKIFIVIVVLLSSNVLAHMDHYKKYNKIEMDIFRNGELIGYNYYFFTRKGDETIITNQIKFSVKILGATIFQVEGYGEEKYKFRNYTTKSKGAQEAHECIRPTNMKISHPDDISLNNDSDDENSDGKVSKIEYDEVQKKLYHLIWQRTMASQLVPAEYEVIELKIENSKDTSEDGIFVSRFRRRLCDFVHNSSHNDIHVRNFDNFSLKLFILEVTSCFHLLYFYSFHVIHRIHC
mgnify:CR=1 FL=1